jgi:hypothetical protein
MNVMNIDISYSDFKQYISCDTKSMEQWILRDEFVTILQYPQNMYTHLPYGHIGNFRSKADYISITINKPYDMWRKLIINGLLSCNKYIDIIFNNCIINDDSMILLKQLLDIHDIVYNIKQDTKDCVIFYGIMNNMDNMDNMDNMEKNNKIAVCTCIFNNYDTLQTLPEIPSDLRDRIDFYCFTDDPNLNVNDETRWIVDSTPYHYLDTEVDIKGRISTSLSKEMENHYNIVSKYYKTCLHRIPRLKEYSYFLYIDGSIQLKILEFLSEIVYNNESDTKFMLFRHPERSAIWQESIVGKNYTRYMNQPLIEQVNSYYNEGYKPHDNYLVATGFHVRPNTRLYNSMYMTWYYEIQKWSDLCQISFPFCNWLYDVRPLILDENIYNSSYTLFYKHVFRY